MIHVQQSRQSNMFMNVLGVLCTYVVGGVAYPNIITGENVTTIPADMTPVDMVALKIVEAGITTLNFSELAPYQNLRHLYIHHTPIKRIIPAPLNDTPSLYHFDIFSYHSEDLPYLGQVESQLQIFSLHGHVSKVTPFYFEHFSSLIDLELALTRIDYLNATLMNGLENIKYLRIAATPLGEIPSLELWTPRLIKLELQGIGASFIPKSLLRGLPDLQLLDVKDNKIQALPDATDFRYQLSPLTVNVTMNPLICDQRIAWLKVCGAFYPTNTQR